MVNKTELNPFKWFKKTSKYGDNRTYDLQHEDQEAGAEANRSKAQIKRLKAQLDMDRYRLEHERDRLRLEAEIKELQMDLEDLDATDEPIQEDNSVEKMVMGLIASSMMSKKGNSTPEFTGNTVQEVTPEGEPSNAELRQLWTKLPPNYKDQALNMIKK
jgi:hypothetical protein